MIPPEEAVAFVWSGQEGLAELVFDYSKRCHFHPDEALHVLADYRCFGPILRSRPASTKDAVAPMANVLWADIDDRDAANLIDERLRRGLGIEPSLIVDSGNKGFWAYLKLDRLIPSGEIEVLNKRLALLLEGDHVGNRDRLARLPGSIHPDSGRRAEIVDIAATIHAPEELSEVLPALDRLRPSTLEYQPEEIDRGMSPRPDPFFSDELREYIARRPKRGEGWDRSAVEYKIFYILVQKGWTDQEIIDFANRKSLPRHVQDRMRLGDYRWTLRSIRKAREYSSSRPPSTSYIHTPMCNKIRRYGCLDLLIFLKEISGLTVKEAIGKAQSVFEVSERTVYDALRRLEDADYIRREVEGRRRRIRLTDKGEAAITRRFGPPVVVIRLRDPEGQKGVVSR